MWAAGSARARLATEGAHPPTEMPHAVGRASPARARAACITERRLAVSWAPPPVAMIASGMQTRVWVDPELLERVAAEFEGTNYKAVAFNPEQPPDRGVVLLRHAQRAEELAQQRIKLAVVAVL